MANDGIQVLISYKQLEELLKASGEIKELRKEISRLERQVLALRMIQQECMELIGDLKKLI